MKIYESLLWLLLLSSLLVTSLSVVYADSNVLIASYTNGSETNSDWLDRLHPSSDFGGSAVSESFQSSSSVLRITIASFQLYKFGSPSGMAHAKLYEMGSGDSPNGSALATSDDFDVSSVIAGSYSWYNLTFSGSQKYTMQLSHSYCIVFEDPTSGIMTFMNFLYIRANYSGGYSGICKGFHDSVWNAIQPLGSDLLFRVYGEIPTVPSPQTTQTWIGIAAPHVYAAITIWSLAMIIGVGAALSKGIDIADLPYLVLMGLGILICLFVALAIMSGFLNL